MAALNTFSFTEISSACAYPPAASCNPCTMPVHRIHVLLPALLSLPPPPSSLSPPLVEGERTDREFGRKKGSGEEEKLPGNTRVCARVYAEVVEGVEGCEEEGRGGRRKLRGVEGVYMQGGWEGEVRKSW